LTAQDPPNGSVNNPYRAGYDGHALIVFRPGL